MGSLVQRGAAGHTPPAMTAAPSLRLILQYVAIFTVVGVHLPFWPVWLESRGLGGGEIGIVLSVYSLSKLVANPLVTHWADRRGERRGMLVRLAVAALVTFCLFPWVDGVVGLFLLSVVWASAFNPVMPLTESTAMAAVSRYGLDYGRMRLWGSLAFIGAAMGIGALLEGRGPQVIWVVLLGGLVLLALTSLFQPAGEATSTGPRAGGGAGTLVRDRRMLLFLAATGMAHVSHVIYYGFSALHWRAAGLPDWLVGALWAEGVIAEVLLFAVSNRAVAACGPVLLLALAGLGGMVRWTVLGLTTDPALLALVQPLHALTFGATHLGAMHFIARAAPAGRAATAQGLYSAAGMGGAMGLALLGAGHLHDALDSGAFLLMAGVSAAGLALATRLGRAWDGGRLA